MNITITWQMVAFAITMTIGWTGFLLGAIKWLLNKQITGLEARLASAEKTAGNAVKELSEHKETVTQALSQLRIEFASKPGCANHREMHHCLDKLGTDVGWIKGKMDGLNRVVDLMNQFLIEQGRIK